MFERSYFYSGVAQAPSAYKYFSGIYKHRSWFAQPAKVHNAVIKSQTLGAPSEPIIHLVQLVRV